MRGFFRPKTIGVAAGVILPPSKTAGKAPHSNEADEDFSELAEELGVSLEETASQEVIKQLSAQGGEGKVYINDWWQRFPGMGSMRQFIEAYPEKFAIIPGLGNGYTVALSDMSLLLDVPQVKGKGKGKGVSGGKGFGKGKGGGQMALGPPIDKGKGKSGEDFETLSAAAIIEITEQLVAPESTGRVWIDDWNGRFLPVLGNLRTFLEGHPDNFVVIPRGGRAYLVALTGDEAAIAQRSGETGLPKGNGCKSFGGCKGFGGCMGKGGKIMPIHPPRDRILGGDPAMSAIHEITSQLQRRKDGRVYIDDWREQYQPVLGPMREFIESVPESFILIPGEGRRYTVELVDGPIHKRSRDDGNHGDLDPKRHRPFERPDVSEADQIDSDDFGN